MDTQYIKTGVVYGLTAGLIIALLEFRVSLLTHALSNRSLSELGLENIVAPIIINILFYCFCGVVIALLTGLVLAVTGRQWSSRKRNIPQTEESPLPYDPRIPHEDDCLMQED